MVCNFKLVLEGKTGKEIPGPSRLEFLEKFLCKQFWFDENLSGEAMALKLINYDSSPEKADTYCCM